ncbi:MAG: ComF family protein [Marinagarivorans sp.]|nr:ComF family protein [Marinagarivorans sp.]
MHFFNAGTFIKPYFKQGLTLGLRYGFKPLCALCECACEKTLALCEACLADLARIRHACFCCGLPFEQTTARTTYDLCGDCLQNPKPFQSTRCALLYQNPTSHLIHQFKQQSHWQLGHLLCDIWLQQHQPQLQNTLTKDCILVPIPSHPRRTAERGYCPSHFIAEHLSQPLNLAVKHLLINQRLTPPQKSLNRAQRLRNLDDVFTCPSNSLCPTVTRIILVDDVVTTCATVMAASHALNTAGFYDIQVWALARTSFNS